jgi:hypothetical protein
MNDNKVDYQENFNSSDERESYLKQLKLQFSILVEKRNTFQRRYDMLLSADSDDDAEKQKNVDDQIEQDALFLIEVNERIVRTSTHINDLEIQAKGEKKITDQITNGDAANRMISTNNKVTVKLPKLTLTKFDGNVLLWQEFWDSFESSVHNNQSLSNVDKMNYLKAQLTNSAKSSIAGLASTDANYAAAIQRLQDRFGRKQLVIDAHYSALSNLAQATN